MHGISSGLSILIDYQRVPRMPYSGRRDLLAPYELVVSWSEADHAFLVAVPELPGCMADGGTYQEAVAHAEQAITEWLETARDLGRPIPTPPRVSASGVQALRSNARSRPTRSI